MTLKVIAPFGNKHSGLYSIKIHKDKVVTYTGIAPFKKKDENNHDYAFGTYMFNNKYKYEKIDKYDRMENSLEKANYKITSILLNDFLNVETYLYLNFIQELRLKWFNEKYMIQNIDFKKSIYISVFSAMLGAVITLTTQRIIKSNKTPTEAPSKQIKKKRLVINSKRKNKSDSIQLK